MFNLNVVIIEVILLGAEPQFAFYNEKQIILNTEDFVGGIYYKSI